MRINKITDFSTMSIEDIITEIEQNQRKASTMKAEIEKIKLGDINNIASDIKKDELPTSPTIVTADYPSITEESTSILEEDIDFYYQNLKKLINSPDLYEKIKDILPSKTDYTYNEVIRGIKLRFLKDINENYQIINYFKEDISAADLEEFKTQITLDNEKIKLINLIQNKKEPSVTVNEKTVNELIFTTTSGGNIRALEEINYISQEFYSSLKILLDSIIDGTFKNLKHFNNHNDLVGVSQVKDYQTRVVFKRIGKNAYAIITMFIKKSDNDKGYKLNLINRINEFRNQEDRLKQSLDNEEFIAENRHYKEELYNILLQSSKNKTLIKVGEDNE